MSRIDHTYAVTWDEPVKNRFAGDSQHAIGDLLSPAGFHDDWPAGASHSLANADGVGAAQLREHCEHRLPCGVFVSTLSQKAAEYAVGRGDGVLQVGHRDSVGQAVEDRGELCAGRAGLRFPQPLLESVQGGPSGDTFEQRVPAGRERIGATNRFDGEVSDRRSLTQFAQLQFDVVAGRRRPTHQQDDADKNQNERSHRQ